MKCKHSLKKDIKSLDIQETVEGENGSITTKTYCEEVYTVKCSKCSKVFELSWAAYQPDSELQGTS